MSEKEQDEALSQLYENETDSESDETNVELAKNGRDARYVEIDELNGLVCKRGRGAVASLRVSREVSLIPGYGRVKVIVIER